MLRMFEKLRRVVHARLRGALRYLFGRRGQRRVQGYRLLYRLRSQVLLHSAEPIAKLTRRATVRVFVDGEEVFPRIERLLSRARHTIIIRMFIWADDRTGRRIASTLLDAADRGVQVHITKEAVGDNFEVGRDFLGTKNSGDALWDRFWNHPNIHVVYETNDDHAKVFVIDGETLVLTGMNIADEYRYDWHDYMVELRGSHFVHRCLMDGEVASEKGPVRIVVNTPVRKEIRPMVMKLIREATDSIVIEQIYMSDPEVIAALVKRSHEGVRVTVIIPRWPGFHYFSIMEAIARLITEGDPRRVQVFLYPRMIHGKIMLIDHSRLFIGSANLIPSSIDHMGEVNVLLEGWPLTVIHRMREVLKSDILISRPLTSPLPFRWIGKWLAALGL